MTISSPTSTVSSISVPVGGGKFATIPTIATSINGRFAAHRTIRQVATDGTVTFDRIFYSVTFIPKGLALPCMLTRAQALYLIGRLPYFDTGFKHVNKDERKYRRFMQRLNQVLKAMGVV